MNTNQKGFASIVLIIALVVILVGGFGYFELTKTPITPATATTTEQTLTQQRQSVTRQDMVESSKTFSTHQSIKAYLDGPTEITTNTIWKGSVVIPQNTIGIANAPDVMWGDGTADPEFGGSPWQYDSAGNASVTHTYTKPGSYTITVYINGGEGVGFEQGTVVIKKTIVVQQTASKQNVPAYKPGPSDEKIESLIRSANLTEIQPVNVFVYLPENKVKVFEVKYGPAQDCESGCFYSKAVGIEYNNKIGWITAHGSDFEKYNFDQNDLYLYIDEFFKLFQSRNSRIYSNEFLSMLIADKDVPEQIKTKAKSFIDYDRKNI